jgi:hypothetical protein
MEGDQKDEDQGKKGLETEDFIKNRTVPGVNGGKIQAYQGHQQGYSHFGRADPYKGKGGGPCLHSPGDTQGPNRRIQGYKEVFPPYLSRLSAGIEGITGQTKGEKAQDI